MLFRVVPAILLPAALLLLAACEGAPPTPGPSPYTGYLTEEIPPCTPAPGSSVDPCEPGLFGVTSGGTSLEIFGPEPRTVQAFIDGRNFTTPLGDRYAAHLVVRGTYLPGTVRCADAGVFRPPPYLDRNAWTFALDTGTVKCYADVRANAYLLGSGPSTLTVLVKRFAYWLRWEGEGGERLRNAAERAFIETPAGVSVEVYEGTASRIVTGITGREVVLFLGPASDVTAEAWQAHATWDVQRQEDGTVLAVHPYRDRFFYRYSPDEYQAHLSALEMELPALTQAVTTAHQVRIAEYGGRIGSEDIPDRAEGVELPMLVTDANHLRQFYIDTGAYDHPDGPPVQPLPPCGLAVPDQGANPGLMQDCIALLAARDALRGAATLNWSTDTPITGWQGVLVQGKPARVQELTLANLGLSGTIPPELGRLDDLRRLELDGNKLTGPIPSELGDLAHLHLLYLFDNQLTGALPASLGRLHRLEALFAQGNRLSGTIPPELGGMVSLQQLLLSDNRLTRPIPSGLSGLRGLSELWLSGNALTGAIPSWLSELSALTILSLRDNKLTGGIPAGLGGLSDLQDLYLSGNSLTGCIPPALRSVPHHDLAGLRLPDCATGAVSS